MKLTNEEIAKVFTLYFNPKEKMFINPDSGITYYGTLYQLSSMRGVLYGYKLRVTPLSEISDEHVIECVYLNWPDQRENFVDTEWAKKVIGTISNRWDIREYLISKGYAVPLFFSPNHHANGLNAIELEIAIDKTLLTLPV